jgi:hypothetical protein
MSALLRFDFIVWMRSQFAIAVLLTTVGFGLASAAEPELRFPNAFAFATASRACAAAYFHCNHSTGTCMRGRVSHRGFAGVMLADDRKTVIAHMACDAHTDALILILAQSPLSGMDVQS